MFSLRFYIFGTVIVNQFHVEEIFIFLKKI